MARFAGKVGFAISTEVRPGVWKDIITERNYYGNINREARQSITSDKINDDLVFETTVEVVGADEFASEQIFAIRYVIEQTGTKWKVTNAAVQGARLLLRLGGVYNGPTASVSS